MHDPPGEPSGEAPRNRRSTWKAAGPGILVAQFRGARAHRIPPGVNWSDVVSQTTTDLHTDEAVEHVTEELNAISAKQAQRNLDMVRDIEVEVQYRRTEDAEAAVGYGGAGGSDIWAQLKCRAGQSWADAVDDDNDDDDDDDDAQQHIHRARVSGINGVGKEAKQNTPILTASWSGEVVRWIKCVSWSW